MNVQRELQRFLLNPAEEVAYHSGWLLRGMTIKTKPDGYLLVVKVERRLDGHMVAFIEGTTLIDCFEYLLLSMTHTNAPLKWRKDRF